MNEKTQKNSKVYSEVQSRVKKSSTLGEEIEIIEWKRKSTSIVGTDQKTMKKDEYFVFARSPYSSLWLCGPHMCQILKTDSIDRMNNSKVLNLINSFFHTWF